MNVYVSAFEARQPFRWNIDSSAPMEQSLIEQQTALRGALDRNQDLAGRLINAQEAERTRIARDLHDDVSQQVAWVAMMLGGLKRDLGASGVRPEVQEDVAALQKQTSRLADAIRELSHELHPGVLKHAGLVPALNQYCGEIGRQHGITVDFSPQGNFTDIDFDVALCVCTA